MLNCSTHPDKRIDREAKALQEEGHSVFLICSETKKYGQIPDVYEKIFFLPIDFHVYLDYYFQNRKAAKICKKVIDEIKPDVVQAHDIKAAGIGLLCVPKETIFIFDDHEIPELSNKLNLDQAKGIFKKIVHYYRFVLMKYVFKRVTRRANLIVVVNEKVIDFYEKKKINRSKMIAIENYASNDTLQIAKENADLVHEFFKKDKRKKIVHVSKGGKLSKDRVRDISIFVEAVTELDNWIIVVFGPHDETYENYDVQFVPPVPRNEYLASCLKCDLALNTLIDTERTQYCSSNRLFEFVALGLRVISNRVNTLVEKFGNYLIWMENLKTKDDVIKLLTNIDSYPSSEEIKEKSLEFIWEEEIKKLVNQYKRLLERK